MNFVTSEATQNEQHHQRARRRSQTLPAFRICQDCLSLEDTPPTALSLPVIHISQGCLSPEDIPSTPYFYSPCNDVNLLVPVTPSRFNHGDACVDPVQEAPSQFDYLALDDIPLTPGFDSVDADLQFYSLTPVSPTSKLTEIAVDGWSSRYSTSSISTEGAPSPQSIVSAEEMYTQPAHTPGVLNTAGRLADRDHNHSPEPQESGHDWYCPTCCDIQFQKNDHCRMCGLHREYGVFEVKDLKPEMFLKGHNIASDVAAEFRSLSSLLQQLVMSGGSLHKTRKPTAVLCTRIRKAKKMNTTVDGEPSCAMLGFDKKQKPKAPIGSPCKRR